MAKHTYKLNRKSLRLPEFDYSQNGAYFVTLIAHKRQHLFGEIICGELFLNDVGMIVQKVWSEIPTHFSNVNNNIFISF